MTPRAISLASLLTYSGTLPLIACAVHLAAALAWLNAPTLALCYASVILSFLAGIHWAVFLFGAQPCPQNLLIRSNAVALLAWASLLISPQLMAFALQAVLFLYLLLLDQSLHRAGAMPTWFFTLRCRATAIVVCCLLVIGVLA